MSNQDPTPLLLDLDLALAMTPRESPIHDFLASLRPSFKRSPFTTTTGMVIDAQTKWITHTFPKSFSKRHKELEILHLTDVQFGSAKCRVDKLIEYRDWVLAEPYRFVVLGGDLVDAYRIGSPGQPWDNLFSPESQLYRFCQIIAPLRHRILGSVGGNHERRALAGGMDLGSLIAMVLGIPYSGGCQMVSLENYWRSEPIRLYLWHGRGAARTAGGHVNMMLSAVPNDEAHVYFSGHIHRSYVVPGWHVLRDEKRREMLPRRYYCVSAASFLEFYGSYAEVAGYAYSGLLMPLTYFRSDGRYRVVV